MLNAAFNIFENWKWENKFDFILIWPNKAERMVASEMGNQIKMNFTTNYLRKKSKEFH
jgi:hypothetical protein